jgi:3-methyladenine DNA glycosylase AlkC
MRITSANVNVPVQTSEQKPPQRHQTEANAAKGAVANAAKQVANAASSAAVEASETTAQTRTEASSGDQQAVRKLAQEAKAQSTAAASQPGIGANLKITA